MPVASHIPGAPPVRPGEPAHLAQARALYERGRYLDAYRAIGAPLPIDGARAPAERVLFGRISMNTGNSRRARLEFLRAFREAPGDPEVRCYHAMTLLQRFGPIDALRFLSAPLREPTVELQSDWLLTHANAYGALRDFETAERYQKEAEALAPEHPWVWVQRSDLFELQDEPAEAIAAARRSLELRAWYRPGVQQLAHALQLMNQDDEALELLVQASAVLQSPGVHWQRAAMELELGRPADAKRSYLRALELSPEMDRVTFTQGAAALSHLAALEGDNALAADLLDLFGKGPAEKAAARLREGPGTRRHLLPVPFVRQHHVTCAPATLTSLCRYWDMPADHLEVAEAICYDGTPARSERKWAEEHGFVAREFTADWDTAVTLLDRGVPFTLTTTGATSAHLQAVIGYDSRRRLLLVRDPGTRYLVQHEADVLFEHQAPSGPRGMAIVPRHPPERLAGVALPDAELYDALHALELHLEAHRRAEAGEVASDMERSAPEHRLTLEAGIALAGYDGDQHARRDRIERLLARYPKDPRLLLHKATGFPELVPPAERVAILAELCARPKPDPHLLLAYATELVDDARNHDTAEFLLRRALHRAREAANGYASLARIRWSQGRKDEALGLYRMAACVAEKNEQHASAYFGTAQALGRAGEALRLLDDRFVRFGGRSGGPCVTLVNALEAADRQPDALVVLEQGLRRQPDDGYLKLRAMGTFVAAGDLDRAAALLEQARATVREVDLWRASARLALARAEPQEALAQWQKVLAAEPLAMDAHEQVCRLLTRGEGPERAIEHLARAVARFTHHVPLHSMYLQWVRDHVPAEGERLARRILELQPSNAWARRELAIALARQWRLDEALAEARAARLMEPESSYGPSVEAAVLEWRGEPRLARTAWRAALALDADRSQTVEQLLRSCRSLDERREVLTEIAQAIDRQHLLNGEGLLAFFDAARDVEPPEDLLPVLTRWRERKPDLWAAAAAVTRHLRDTGKLDEAAAAAQALVERFPLLPGSWLDLASVRELQGDAAGEEDALRRAWRLNPHWGLTARRLIALHQRQKQPDRARQAADEALRFAADDAELLLVRARLAWEQGEQEQAIALVERGLRFDPSLQEAWDQLARWRDDRREYPLAITFAREVKALRPSSAYPCLAEAEMLPQGELASRLELLDEAIRRVPRMGELYDKKAVLLAKAKRFDEAKQTCHPSIFGELAPRELRARSAWVSAEAGDHPKAVAEVRELLEREGDYVWAILRLIDWTMELKDAKAAIAASLRLVDLQPDAPQSHGYLADAYRLDGDVARWKEELERAFALDPAYGFALVHLFDFELERQRYAEAKALLDRAEGKAHPSLVYSRMVVLAAATADETLADFALTRLLQTAPEDAEARRVATEAIYRRGWEWTVRRVLATVSQAEGPVSLALADWWGPLLAADLFPFAAWEKLGELRELGELGHAATAAYVEALAERGKLRSVRWFLRMHRKVVDGSRRIYGAVTYGLATLGAYARLVKFARGWRAQPWLEPWMLSNIVIAARAEGNRPFAAEVAEEALRRTEDSTTASLRVWLANEKALAGEHEQAKGLLVRATVGPDQGLVTRVLRITEALLGVTDADAAKSVRHLFGPVPFLQAGQSDRAWHRVIVDVAWALARRHPGAGAYLWWLRNYLAWWLQADLERS